VEKLPLLQVLKGSYLVLPPASMPGNYKVVYKKDDTLFVSANISTSESNLISASKGDMEKLVQHFQAVENSFHQHLLPFLAGLEQGKDLTFLLLTLIFLLFFLEVFVLYRSSE
jgi:hypothetical protein